MNFDKNSVVYALIAGTILIVVLCLGLMLLLITYTKRRIAEQNRLVQLKTEHTKAVMTSRLEMQEQTFQHISREIHDSINTSLTFSLRQLESMNELNSHQRSVVEKAMGYTTHALENLRNLSQSLNANLIMKKGFETILENDIENLKSLGKYDIEYVSEGIERKFDPDRELLILRIMQESLKNIIEHADASEIRITVAYWQRVLWIQIDDNGRGFQYPITNEQSKGTGIDNIETRARVLNASLSIASAPGKGTTIDLFIPYDK